MIYLGFENLHKNIRGCKFWRSAHHSAKPTLEWWTADTTSLQLVAAGLAG